MSDRHAISNALQKSRELFALGATQVTVLQTKYREFVLHNPEIVSKIESTLRALSYMLPGQFGASGILAELAFSASQLLTLLNDGIFREGKRFYDHEAPPEGNRILLWLTVVEYLEVFIELGASRVWGEGGKWLIVVVLQIAKAALRFVLLFKYKTGIQRTPLIPPLDRSKVFPESERNDEDDFNDEVPEEELACSEEDDRESQATSSDNNQQRRKPIWKGARSGRRMRSLAATPPGATRSWKIPKEHLEEKTTSLTPTELSTRRLFAESLYISRPLLHISSMFLFGQNSWKPWLLSCGVDVTSLALLGDPSDLNEAEKSEMSRRTLLLLFYLLRSPFYDSYSKTRILGFLRFLSDTVPGVSLVLNPLLDYLPTWQKIYFYNWGS